jgi:putative ABC transport system permease protein
MQKWLQIFVCRTELNCSLFLISGILTFGIALLTVSWQSWRAATMNPVDALKDE